MAAVMSEKRAYQPSDVAFIIPTKDRPRKIKNLLVSIAEQSVMCGRLIVVDGGKSVKDIVMSFLDRLPVEYYECYPPGQIKQRNMAISLLDNRTPLVGFLDDDIVLEDGALSVVINFWNECEINTAGVSFNIFNQPKHRTSWIKVLLNLSAFEQGRVLRSGMTTPNSPVDGDIKSQWLCGGATIWRKAILYEFKHNEISSRWAIGEDLIFSYPIGKKYPLHVCAKAKVRHEHEMDYVPNKRHRFHGCVQTLWLIYFVESNGDLSRSLFLWTLLLRITGKLLIGILTFRVAHLEFAFGQIEGTIKGLKTLISRKDIISIFREE